jgi:hypothetical protein
VHHRSHCRFARRSFSCAQRRLGVFMNAVNLVFLEEKGAAASALFTHQILT